MTTKNEGLITALNGLVEVCKDGEKGYREASESIHNGYDQILLSEFARQRGQFASRLQARVRVLGGNPERKGSVVGTIHRGWMNLKAAIARKNYVAILTECERGEHAALKNYHTVSKIDLPEDIKDMIAQQSLQIEETIQRLAVMRN